MAASLVPHFSRIDHGEVESWHLWRSPTPSAHQRSRVWKLNERSRTRSIEGICFCREKLYWQQEVQELRKTCHQYADCFQKPRMQNALLILTYGLVSWESGINERQAGGEIPSGHERDGDQVSGMLGCSHDGWLLLDSEERHPYCWAF